MSGSLLAFEKGSTARESIPLVMDPQQHPHASIKAKSAKVKEIVGPTHKDGVEDLLITP